MARRGPRRRRVPRLRRMLGRHHRHRKRRRTLSAKPIAERRLSGDARPRTLQSFGGNRHRRARCWRCSTSDDEAAEMQAVIARQALQMSRIVDDLLDVSRIARGKLRLRRQFVNLRQLLHDTVEDYRQSRTLDQCRASSRFRRMTYGCGPTRRRLHGVLEFDSQQLQVQRRSQ